MLDPLKQFIDDTTRRVADRYAATDYTESYVAFLDILGMKSLVNSPYSDLRAIFNTAEAGIEIYSKIRVGDRQFIGQSHLKIMVMSDALVLSIDSNLDYAFSKLVGFSSYLITNLLKTLESPVFLRGGIIRGLIFHDDRTVFGPGLVEAYNLENEVAKSMRCVVSPELVERDTSVQEYLNHPGCALVSDIDDGLYFIHFAKPEFRDRLRRTAIESIEADIDDKIKYKYRWLLRYAESQLGS